VIGRILVQQRVQQKSPAGFWLTQHFPNFGKISDLLWFFLKIFKKEGIMITLNSQKK